MKILVIKKNVGLERLYYFRFLYTAKEENLIYVDTPVPKRLDYSHFSRGVASRNDRNPDGRKLNAERKSLLQPREFPQ